MKLSFILQKGFEKANNWADRHRYWQAEQHAVNFRGRTQNGALLKAYSNFWEQIKPLC